MSDWTTVVRNKSIKSTTVSQPKKPEEEIIRDERKQDVVNLWKEIETQRKQKKQSIYMEQKREKQMKQKKYSQQPWRPFQEDYKMTSEDILLQEEETLKYAEGWRPLKCSDFTLTMKELELVENQHLSFCCECCRSSDIERIIKRPFTNCGFCYCCAGDNASFDYPNLRIYMEPTNIHNKKFIWI
jgi:hypothetical protein